MKMFKLAAIALAASAFVAAPAMAKDNGDQGRNKHGKNTRVVVVNQDRDRDHRYNGERNDGGRYSRDRNGRVIVIRDDDRNRRYHGNGKWDNGRRGAPSWARGRDYRTYGYDRVVYVQPNDYNRYRLYQPRQGYRWVRDDMGHYMMVSVVSGVIADILTRGL